MYRGGWIPWEFTVVQAGEPWEFTAVQGGGGGVTVGVHSCTGGTLGVYSCTGGGGGGGYPGSSQLYDLIYEKTELERNKNSVCSKKRSSSRLFQARCVDSRAGWLRERWDKVGQTRAKWRNSGR